jgi:hypothetical protein
MRHIGAKVDQALRALAEQLYQRFGRPMIDCERPPLLREDGAAVKSL